MAFDLADLLTAAGQAMGAANRRLAETCAPALLREFALELAVATEVSVPEGAATLLLNGISPPNPQLEALVQPAKAVAIKAVYIAAPGLVPVPVVPPAGGCDP